jgi:formate hydrogenlyase transcriptional activator
MDTVEIADIEHWCQHTDQLAAEFSSALGRIEFAELEPAITSLLERVGETIGVDRATLVEYGEDGDVIKALFWSNPSLGSGAIPVDIDETAWLWERLRPERDALVLERIPADLPAQTLTPTVLEYLRRTPLRSAVVLPVHVAGELVCTLSLETVREPHAWPPALLERLQLLAALVGSALQRRRQDAELRESRAELKRLAARIEHEQEPTDDDAPVPELDGVIGTSPALRMAVARVHEVAPTSSTVLLLGETGTGKELFARAIHMHGPRRGNPLVVVNCAALPPTLIESELFGHARGAFTGAIATRQGRFELAHRGSLFLDEIGDLPLDLQAKLLRVLQEGSFERVGSSTTQKVDVRIIAATHRDLGKAVADGTFRDDLYYRLSVFPIPLPPLRQRREDIPSLVWYLIHKRQRSVHRWIKRVPEEVMDTLQRYDWPGNIRELENVIERALIHSTGDTLRLLDDPIAHAEAAVVPTDDSTLSAVERLHIEEVLRACRGRINGPGNAAERLGLHPNTLRFRMKKLGIVRDPSHTGVHIAGA